MFCNLPNSSDKHVTNTLYESSIWRERYQISMRNIQITVASPRFLKRVQEKDSISIAIFLHSLSAFLKSLFGWLDSVVSCGLILSSGSTGAQNLLVTLET